MRIIERSSSIKSKMVLYGGFFSFVFVMMCIDRIKWHARKSFDGYEDFSNAYVRDEFAMSLAVSVVMYSVVLIMGVIKKDRMLCVPWLLLKTFMFFVSFLFMMESIYHRFSYVYKTMETFIHLAYIGLDAYQICIVYCFYKELKVKDGEYD